MKRWRNINLFALPFTVNVLLLGLFGCGTSESSRDTTPVSLTIQTAPTKEVSLKAFAPVPPGITDLEIVVSEGELELIKDSLSVTSGEVATWTREVPNGLNRVFSVTASGNGSSCTGKSKPVNLVGQEVTIEIEMEEGCPPSQPEPEPPFILRVDIVGDGNGLVSSIPSGIDCEGDCTERFSDGTIVSLVVTPDAGSFFAGLSGHPDCADGSVTMTSDITCTAAFELLKVGAVTAGDGHSCAQITDGTLQCWGNNGYGQLGDNSTSPSLVPLSVSVITNATDVSAGKEHTCAIVDGRVFCWGSNAFGQLGDGSTDDSTIPVEVVGITNVSLVSSGKGHTCAISNGRVSCWGNNGYGQLGNGSKASSPTPIAVPGITNATDISSGKGHTCSLSDGRVKCWGSNGFGQLGNRSTRDSTEPVAVFGISDATQISSGGHHSCARLSNGTLKCWGWNRRGQLGNGEYYGISSEPVTVSGIDNAIKVSLGWEHSCALLSDGTLSCWGGNHFGQVGDGSGDFLKVLLPFPVSGAIVTATDIASGSFHSCASLADGRVKCWGDNQFGQLGDGTTDGIDTPVTVIGLP